MAGVADVLKSRGVGVEKAKRSSKTSPNLWFLIVNSESGQDPDYPIESTPGGEKETIKNRISSLERATRRLSNFSTNWRSALIYNYLQSNRP